jgi:Flp pilus assembly protein TadG
MRLLLTRDERGAAAIETAFALPIFIMLLWAIIQFGLMFRATAGMQHALGEGARYATIFPRPADADVKAFVKAKVYGIGPGTFADPVITSGPGYLDLSVNYKQPTSLLLLPGPTIDVTKTKRVWVAS